MGVVILEVGVATVDPRGVGATVEVVVIEVGVDTVEVGVDMGEEEVVATKPSLSQSHISLASGRDMRGG